jgi:hypothetical protein
MSIDINAAKAVIDRSMSQLAGFNGALQPGKTVCSLGGLTYELDVSNDGRWGLRIYAPAGGGPAETGRTVFSAVWRGSHGGEILAFERGRWEDALPRQGQG